MMDYMNNLIRARNKNMNQAILPQLVTSLVKIISLQYDTESKRYPVNLYLQSFACKFLKDIIRTTHVFDETSKLNTLIDKLRSELQILRI